MKKLKSKVFWVIMLMLSIFSLVLITAVNIQDYRQEYHQIVSRFDRVDNFDKKPLDNNMNGNSNLAPPPQNNDNKNENVRFADAVVYTVFLDDDKNIVGVINRSDNDVSNDEIKTLAENYIYSNKKEKSVGNLFTSKYSYSLNSNVLTVTDNSQTNSKLTKELLLSLLLFVLIEIIIFFVSKKLTAWIIKPVEESFEKQKQFIADASHELKTPLAVIMASSDALESDREETRWLDNIKSESERMSKLIASLLDLAQSEEYTDTLELESVNLSKIVETSSLSFEGVMFEKGIGLGCNIDDNIIINGDSDKLKQLVSILLDNATHHSFKNTDVQVELHKNDGNITLEVRNHGEPLPQGEEEKVFERFYRSDKSRNRDENRYGLGLAIAKNIVTAHGGKITAFSNDGVTTFKVVFNN